MGDSDLNGLVSGPTITAAGLAKLEFRTKVGAENRFFNGNEHEVIRPELWGVTVDCANRNPGRDLRRL